MELWREAGLASVTDAMRSMEKEDATTMNICIHLSGTPAKISEVTEQADPRCKRDVCDGGSLYL